jgi:NAD(P)-dependent dehydrogenase (short-subunit alcohol dehydrogenase family)
MPLGRITQKNAEEVADHINEALDTLNAAKPLEQHESTQDAKAREKRVRRNTSQLVSLLCEEKHFWIRELDGVASEFPYRRVLDIFVRVNSGGTKLDASDLMFAAMKEGWSGSRRSSKRPPNCGQKTGNVDYKSWADVLNVNTVGPLRVLESFTDHIARSERRMGITITSGMGSLTDNTSGGSIPIAAPRRR